MEPEDVTGDVLATAQAAPLDVEALARVVAELWPDARIGAVTRMEGGLGSVMHRVDLVDAPVPGLVHRGLIPEFGGSGDALVAEVHTHRRLAAAGLPVPEVRWWDPDGILAHRPSLLMDLVLGTTIVGDLERPGVVELLADALAAVHALPQGRFDHLPRLRTVPEHRDWFGSPPSTSPIVDAPRLLATVASLWDRDGGARTVVHGDFHGGNVLWDDGRIVGLLDWTYASIASPWWDEAYAVLDLALVHGDDAGRRFHDRLRARTSVPLPSDDETALWWGTALLRALPSPAMWVEAITDTGGDVTDDEIEARYTTLVEDYLETHG